MFLIPKSVFFFSNLSCTFASLPGLGQQLSACAHMLRTPCIFMSKTFHLKIKKDINFLTFNRVSHLSLKLNLKKLNNKSHFTFTDLMHFQVKVDDATACNRKLLLQRFRNANGPSTFLIQTKTRVKEKNFASISRLSFSLHLKCENIKFVCKSR